LVLTIFILSKGDDFRLIEKAFLQSRHPKEKMMTFFILEIYEYGKNRQSARRD